MSSLHFCCTPQQSKERINYIPKIKEKQEKYVRLYVIMLANKRVCAVMYVGRY
jgi:hypothetical protein